MKKYFPIQKGLMQRVVGYVKAVDDVASSSARARRWGWWAEVAAARRR